MNKHALTLTLTITAGTVLAELPTPIVHWSMDNIDPAYPTSIPNLGTADSTLELSKDVVITNCGAVGKALWFSGARSGYAFSGKSIPGVESRTFSFWVRLNDTVGPFKPANSALKMFENVGSVQVQINTTDEPGTRYTNNDVWFWTSGGYYVSNSRRPRITPGVWTHFALTMDVKSKAASNEDTVYTSDVRLYENGVRIFSEDDALLKNIDIAAQWFVGTCRNTNQPMTGGLDEIKMWDMALTDEQVFEEFARGDGAKHTRLLCNFDFDKVASDGSGGFTVPNDAESCSDFPLLVSSATLVDGPGGKALHFDGTDGTGAETTVPFATGESTIAFWCRVEKDDNYKVNPPFFQWGNHEMGVVASIDRSYMTYMLKYQLAYDTTQFEVDPGYVGRDGWQHFVIVRRHRWEPSLEKAVTMAEIWYNGICIHTGDLAKAHDAWYTLPNQTLTLGKENKYDFRLNGDLKDFQLFAGALSTNDIVRLYRGPAAVDAGIDFAVVASETVLHGSVASRAGNHVRGYDGEVRWTLVSAPTGGEGVVFMRPANPETEVTLPVVGDYVFRLETKGLVKTLSDTVRVTRTTVTGETPTVTAVCDMADIELPGGAPLTATVSDGASVSWSMVSGEGAVWFDPPNSAKTVCRFSAPGAYVLRVTALKDGETCSADVACTVAAAPEGTGIDDGILHQWTFDGLPGATYKDAVASLEIVNFDFAKIGVGAGSSQAGLQVRDPTQGAELGTYATALHEDYWTGYTAHELPKDEWRTFSVWIYQDAAKSAAMRHYAPCIISERLSLWCTLNRYLDPKTDGIQQTPGLTIVQWGNAGKRSVLWYPAPYSFTNRWTHLVFQINRHDTSLCELWIDGIRQTAAAKDLARYSAGPLNGKYSGGRVVAQKVMLGGIDYTETDYTTEVNNAYSVAKDAEGNIYYRTFPGNVDDLRIYGRKLNPGEVRFLAQNPDIGVNFAPYVSTANLATTDVVRRRPVGLSADAVVYGNKHSATTYAWEVASGEASKVVFANPAARETEVTFLAAGTYRLLLRVSDGERTTYGAPHMVEVPRSGMTVILK